MKQLATSTYLGVPFVAEPPQRVVRWLLDQATSRKRAPLPVHLIPAHAVAHVPENREFREALHAPGLVIPDGRWLELLTRKRNPQLFQLRGTDLFLQVCDAGREKQLSHYFFGPDQAVLESLQRTLKQRFPGIRIAGMEVYPFDELDSEARESLADRVKQAGASVVWMGISSPRQNVEAQWIAASTATVVVCVGAALEFVAGVKKSAPRWVQRLGAEWLFRLVSEPRRLWRRYVFDSLRFIRLLWQHRND